VTLGPHALQVLVVSTLPEEGEEGEEGRETVEVLAADAVRVTRDG
jgi:hypothetical protein